MIFNRRKTLSLAISVLAVLLIAAGGYLIHGQFQADTLTSPYILPLRLGASTEPTIGIQASATTDLGVGQQITASVVVDGGGQSFTSFKAGVNLTNFKITDGGFSLGSAVQNWQTQPSAGSLNFAGGVHGTAESVTVYTLTLQTIQPGQAEISLSDGAIYQVASDNTSVSNIMANAAGLSLKVKAAPVVSAGANISGSTDTDYSLNGTVDDNSDTLRWSQISGPGTVNFSSTDSLNPTISSSTPGSYVLQLAATNSASLSGSATVGFVVQQPVANNSDNTGQTSSGTDSSSSTSDVTPSSSAGTQDNSTGDTSLDNTSADNTVPSDTTTPAQSQSADPIKSSVAFDRTSALADGKDAICLTIRLVDSQSNVVSVKPTVTIVGDAIVGDLAALGDAWKACITSAYAGTKEVTVSSSSTQISLGNIEFKSSTTDSPSSDQSAAASTLSFEIPISGSVVPPKSSLLSGNKFNQRSNITISGSAKANSKLDIVVYSTPVKHEVTSDANGNWSVTVASLSPGQHHVEASYANDPSWAAETIASFSVSQFPNTVIVVIGIVVLILILLGGFLFWKKRREASTTQYAPLP